MGTQLMQAVEAEAVSRGCSQIIVQTHDFQAPQFYAKLGFMVIGRIPEYPIGHQESMIKVAPADAYIVTGTEPIPIGPSNDVIGIQSGYFGANLYTAGPLNVQYELIWV